MRRLLVAAVLAGLAGVSSPAAHAWPVPGPVKTDPEEGVLISPTGRVAVLAASCSVAVVATSPYAGQAVILGEAVAAGPVASTTLTCYVAGGTPLTLTRTEQGPVVTIATTSAGPAVRGVCMAGSVRFDDGSEALFGSQLCAF